MAPKRLMSAITLAFALPASCLRKLWFLPPAAFQPLIRNFCPNSRTALALESPRYGRVSGRWTKHNRG